MVEVKTRTVTWNDGIISPAPVQALHCWLFKVGGAWLQEDDHDKDVIVILAVVVSLRSHLDQAKSFMG